MFAFSNASSASNHGSSTPTNATSAQIATANSSSSQLHQNLKQLSSCSYSLQQQQPQTVCTSTLNSQTPSHTPSILDSPTLARVERARLKLEASDSCDSIINTLIGEDIPDRLTLDQPKQSLLAGRSQVCSMTGPIKRGLLWQQRDRLFSRWKERFFVLTRDYLHCFKRASGSANERASDMGQFIFKVKLVDVEKVEWLNRRSYSAIGLVLGREGRVLLRCDNCLEDWFELLEECTITSKERRKALKIAQGPRSRASLAAPVSHTSLQSNYFGLGSTYSSALEDWLMFNESGTHGVRSQKLGTNSMRYENSNPFIFSDSVPDLSNLNNENHNHISGSSTNHSTPQKIPYSAGSSSSRYSNGSTLQNSSLSNCNAMYGSPRRVFVTNNFGSNQIVDEITEEAEVELRRPQLFRVMSTENGNDVDDNGLYRKPKAPTDIRHSVQPMLPTSISSSREIMPNNSGGSFWPKQKQEESNANRVNALYGSRYSVQEHVYKIRNDEEHCSSKMSLNRVNYKELYDQNQNRYCKNTNQSPISTSQHSPAKLQHNGKSSIKNNNNTLLDNAHVSGAFRERYQHPALTAIRNEAQGMKFRTSDSQQMTPRRNVNNNPSPSTGRRIM